MTWKIGLALLVAAAATLLAGTALAGSAQYPNKSPYVKKFSWGTFHLAPRIAEKMQAKKPTINVTMAIVGLTVPVYSPQYMYGFTKVGIPQAQKRYGVKVNGKVIGPNTSQVSATMEVNQIRAEINSNQMDCLTTSPNIAPAEVPVINEAIDKGIPVFTTGSDVPQSHRFGMFRTDWNMEGVLSARMTAKFFKAKHIALKEVMVTGGQPTEDWAQARMNGFYNELRKLVPGVKFATKPSNALATSYDPAQVYTKLKAFLAGHKGVQVVYQVDISGGTVAKVIKDMGLVGKTFSVGENTSLEIYDAIEKGIQIATMDQDYISESAFAALACAAFLKTGVILPNTNKNIVVTKANVKQQRALFLKYNKG